MNHYCIYQKNKKKINNLSSQLWIMCQINIKKIYKNNYMEIVKARDWKILSYNNNNNKIFKQKVKKKNYEFF